MTSSWVCITVSNSSNPSRVYIRLCKHGKCFLLLKCYAVLCYVILMMSLGLFRFMIKL